jgi:hypothetical protein
MGFFEKSELNPGMEKGITPAAAVGCNCDRWYWNRPDPDSESSPRRISFEIRIGHSGLVAGPSHVAGVLAGGSVLGKASGKAAASAPHLSREADRYLGSVPFQSMGTEMAGSLFRICLPVLLPFNPGRRLGSVFHWNAVPVGAVLGRYHYAADAILGAAIAGLVFAVNGL